MKHEVFSRAFVFSIFLTMPAFGQISECVSINQDLDRLACYDRLSGRTSKVEELKPTQTNWTVRREKSEFKDTTDIYLHTESNEVLSCNRFGAASRAKLFLRCVENKTSLFIATDCHLASGFHGYGQVEYRVDQKPTMTRQFDASTDNSALGLWNGSKSISVIKDLFGGEELLVRFTPFNESPVTARFTIGGVEEAIKPLREACNW